VIEIYSHVVTGPVSVWAFHVVHRERGVGPAVDHAVAGQGDVAQHGRRMIENTDPSEIKARAINVRGGGTVYDQVPPKCPRAGDEL
jgi:hypothetical protein